ncbi:MAG: sulfur oxidation c-type cytochrome SoxX [Gammaproteobacteria bacterium]|nr:sulfur oxidation c-type cytochrome SoxX [Gammaproteobacteria bacterium]
MIFDFRFQSVFRWVNKARSRNGQFSIPRKERLAALALLIVLAARVNVAIPDDLPDMDTCQSLDMTVPDRAIEGWCLVIDPGKGNCLACHYLSIAGQPEVLAPSGNIGPILENISEKYPDQVELIELLNDPVTMFPHTIKPPYGKHRILTEREIEAVVVFLSRL